MLTAEAIIRTEYAEQYLARLGKHAAKLGGAGHGHRPRAHGGAQAPPQVEHAEWSATSGIVRLDWGGWTVQADPGTLRLHAEAASRSATGHI